MKLLIAFDDSVHAQAAIRDLRRSGVPRRASAVVISVGEHTLANAAVPAIDLDAHVSRRASAALTGVRAQAADALRQARALAERGSALVKECFPEWDVTTDEHLGDPGRVIVSRARQQQADLVVLGSRGRSVLVRMLLGSVSRHVALHAPGSVLVWRQAASPGGMPVRIVLGVDGSSSSRAAVKAVAARRWPADTEVRVTAVPDTHRPTSTVKPAAAAAWVAEHNEAHRETATAALEQSMQELTGAGVRVSGEIGEGAAHRILCDRAVEFGADAIVVGGHSFASETGLAAASDVMSALMTRAPCSVEIVR